MAECLPLVVSNLGSVHRTVLTNFLRVTAADALGLPADAPSFS
jgi:hypothetical protein